MRKSESDCVDINQENSNYPENVKLNVQTKKPQKNKKYPENTSCWHVLF